MKQQWNKDEMFNRLQEHKKIASVKNHKGIEKVLANKDKIAAVFLLAGSIMNVKRFVDVIQNEGIPVLVHAEKIGGLLLNNEGLDFIADYVKPFGIVTTKTALIKKAKERKLFVVQRVFMIDSEVYESVLENKQNLAPDIIEIMPSTLHEVIRSYSKHLDIPVITGGLLSSTEQVKASLDAGALAISTSNESLWKQDLSKI
ncbi:glycerol-3-phosphate responsive antiterminator [Planococcus sp. N028]|uniref:Glycerol uptake operon antiterminator regulatory protein n=1 Tax=Planococcus shixiaomingii TaxID=3058393 RepID=A0ABT8N543_9BACL|nr:MULTISPECIES: glycerol-3-phosphate responsive antiterminator [unclassified Planococcus (in: firmicutes)]MDN7243000.1 glycerol-3-phosphate responsive antiterminator [Planococcus sp. N028]WKA55376.1 glycerol-3-phosphate responsive antiterminator [Planococcus sp. N022]